MLNEVRARHLKKLVVDELGPSRTIGGIVASEIGRREGTIRDLEEQRKREEDEIVFYRSLDAKKIQSEVEEKKKEG